VFEGHKWSHACTERRALELPNLDPRHLTFTGIRSWMADELAVLAAHPEIGVHPARARGATASDSATRAR